VFLLDIICWIIVVVIVVGKYPRQSSSSTLAHSIASAIRTCPRSVWTDDTVSKLFTGKHIVSFCQKKIGTHFLLGHSQEWEGKGLIQSKHRHTQCLSS
jgi:hypothetical protein